MGVKSTVLLTREEAEKKYMDLTGMGTHVDNKALESALETMNDLLHDGEGFENYIISG